MTGPPGGDPRHSPVLGVLWMTAAALCFSVAIGFVRHLSDTYTTFEIALFRQVLGIVVTSFWVWRVGPGVLRTRVIHFHFVRALLGYGGLVAGYYAVTLISIADAQALQFTLPFFTIGFAAWALKETIRRHRWAATIIGFAGALIIIRPGFAEVGAGVYFVLVTAVLYAANHAMTKPLARTDSGGQIVFYMNLIHLPVFLVLAPLAWTDPTLDDVVWIVLVGICGATAHVFLTRAVRLADLSYLAPIDFLKLPVAAGAGYFLFGDSSGRWTWIGAAVIFACGYYNTVAERAAERDRAARAIGTGTP